MPNSLFSYVVRYDSGFAPNPFFGLCTLATCKPGIRKSAEIGDWIVGTASGGKPVRRGGHIVYAMRVTEIVSTSDYWHDPRFAEKKPNLGRSWVSASGDNIYEPCGPGQWHQLNSYHSNEDGTQRLDHTSRDTGVERILVSDDFVYFGAEGPKLPDVFLDDGEMDLLRAKRNYQRVREEETIAAFIGWLRSIGLSGYQGKPWDWIHRKK